MADIEFITEDVPPGYLANVVTHLEMLAKPDITVPDSPLSINDWTDPEPAEYLELFKKIGAPWLWFSRLLLKESELTAIIHHPDIGIAMVRSGNERVGFIELDFRETGACEIGFLGLVPELNGKGHGSWLMAETLKRAWRPDIERVWLHTCTLDSPRALSFYQRCGFRAFSRQVEVHPDPRATGHLPESAAPHIPLIS